MAERTVLILGAGASYACQSRPGGPRAPLMNSCIRTAVDVLGPERALPPFVQLVLGRYLGSRSSVGSGLFRDIVARSDRINLELLMTWLDVTRKIHKPGANAMYLDAALADVPTVEFLQAALVAAKETYGLFSRDIDAGLRLAKDGRAYQVYDYIYRLMEAHVSYLFLAVLSHCLDDVHCPLHDSLVATLKRGDTVISLNYDLLVDQTLARSSHSWNYASGYGVHPSNFGTLSLFGDKLVSRTSPAPEITLLKLHGSLNWWIVSEGVKDFYAPTTDQHLLYVREGLFEKSFSDFVTTGGTYFRPWNHPWPTMINEYSVQPNVMFRPFLVLPTFDKDWVVAPGVNGYRISATIGDIWGRAYQALAEATRVVLVGYSLPAGDYWIDCLLRSASGAGKMREVVVVNPDGRVLRRIEEVFPFVAAAHYESLDRYLR